MRGDKTGKQGYSLLGEGFSERVIYSIKLAFPLESPHWFFSLSLIPHATDIPMFKLCVFCKSWHSSLHYVFAHGKIHYPRCNIAAKLFRNPSVLGRMVFAFWKHSSKMYMDDHRKQAQLNSLKRHFWMMWRIYWAILWKLNCWFSASHKKMHVGGVILRSVSRQEVLSCGCKPLQDKPCLYPATDKSLTFSVLTQTFPS